ncbi:hypothetical protein DRO66_04945 [Candidatus Bathyarchaeota archaeon]|nr:MAG: hypothetical protein DRO66_04945 [Candidatus Bathyarchaeota archaeon]
MEEAADKKAGDKKKKDREKLEQELKELRIKVLKDGLDEELALSELSSEEEKAKLKGNTEALTLLHEQFANDSFAIKQEYAKKEEELAKATEDEIIANKKEALEISEGLIQRSADEKVLAATTEEAIAQDLADTEVQIEIEKLEKILELRKAAGEDTLEIDQQLANLRRDQAQQEIQAEAERAQLRKEAALELAGTLQDIIAQNIENTANARVAALEEESDKRIETIDKQLEAENLSEEEREKLLEQRSEIEEQTANEASRIQQEAAEKQKELALFKILIEGGVAAVKALSIDPTGVLTAITAAITLAQFAFVSSQPVPQFAEGTPLVSGGIAGKDSVHALLMPKERVVPVADNMKYWGPLEAIRKGNYDDYVYTHNVLPAINNALAAQRQGSNSSFAENVANSLSLNSAFNDRNLLRSDMDTRKILRDISSSLKSLESKDQKSSRQI